MYTHAHPESERKNTQKNHRDTRELGGGDVRKENEIFFRNLPKNLQLTDYHSPPWFHSNPSHLGNPVLVFRYNMHNIDTISYDACSSDHFDHFLSLYSIKILFRFFF